MFLQQAARSPAIVASPETSVLQAIRLMAENDVGAVVVTNAENAVAGIFTERDNMLRVTLKGLDPKSTPLSQVMTHPVKTALPGLDANEALERMLRSKHRHLPVVDSDGKLTGVVSVRHLLMRRLDEQSGDDIETLAAYATAGGPG